MLVAVFERFTESARQVVVLAQEESRSLRHGYIGTEHLLLGLVRKQDGIAAHVLESLGVTLEPVRGEVVRIVGVGNTEGGGQVPFTPEAKRVLELALHESLSLGHNYIGIEHILLALVSLPDGPSVRILRDLDVTPEAVRSTTLAMLGPPQAPRARVAGPPQAGLSRVEELFRIAPGSGARRLLMTAAARALEDGRVMIEPYDLLRALVRDPEIGPLLADLGADEAAVVEALSRRRGPEAPPQASAGG
jgi:ATP-dependent Clp protease ATP-binding subunit ClpC